MFQFTFLCESYAQWFVTVQADTQDEAYDMARAKIHEPDEGSLCFVDPEIDHLYDWEALGNDPPSSIFINPRP